MPHQLAHSLLYVVPGDPVGPAVGAPVGEAVGEASPQPACELHAKLNWHTGLSLRNQGNPYRRARPVDSQCGTARPG